MPEPDSPMAALLGAAMRPGAVAWIGVRPARREPMLALQSVMAEAGQGLEGDRYRTRSDGSRQVTLIQAEHLDAIASYLGLDALDPALLRRNLVIRGINLLGLKDKRFQLGGALLQYSGECHPCSRMEETFGEGGFNAVRGHGGITARVVTGGRIAVGDKLEVTVST